MTARRRPGFLFTWGIPLIAGPLLTAAGVAVLMAVSEPEPAATVPQGVSRAELRRAPAPEGGVSPRVEVVGTARDVTPVGVTPGPPVSGPLTRIVPEEPAVAAAEPGIPLDLYHRIIVLDGGRFRVVRARETVVIRLAGIAAPAFDATCTDPAGKVWKCGAKARAELARLIGSKAIGCTNVDVSDPSSPIARCSVGQRDLGAWMVEQGWADPADPADPILAPVAADAKAAGRGRFGAAPTGVIAG